MNFTQLIGGYRTLNRYRFVADSRQLDDLRLGDWSSMATELAAVMTETEVIQLRYVPLIERICADRAAQYIKRAQRNFNTGSPTADEKMADIWANSRLDRLLLRAQQRSEGQNSVYLLVDPVGPRQIRMTSCLPCEVEPKHGDLLEEDFRGMDRVEVWVPVASNEVGTAYGKRVYTPTEAYLETSGRRVGLFNDEGTNPLGYIPIVGVHLKDPVPGLGHPPLPEDMLSVQIGLVIGLSDVEAINRYKAGGREVVYGDGAADAVREGFVGPNGVLAFDAEVADEGGGIRYEYINTNPATEKYLAAIETTTKLLASYKYVNPEGIWTSSGITGAAKEAERQELLEERERKEIIWQDAEQDLAEVAADVAALRGSAVPVPRVRLHTRFRYTRPPQNDLQSMQARVLQYATGQRNPVQDLADGMSLRDTDRALAEFTDNLARWEEMVQRWRDQSGQVDPPPGLDAIATQLFRG